MCNLLPHISKIQRSISFEIDTYIQHDLLVAQSNFGKTDRRSRSHGHIMYTAEMCLNSVCNIWAHAHLFVYKLLAMTMPVAYPRDQKLWALWPRILLKQTSQICVHVHHEAPVTWPTLTDTPTRVQRLYPAVTVVSESRSQIGFLQDIQQKKISNSHCSTSYRKHYDVQ